MRYAPAFLDELRRRNPLPEFIGRRVKLVRRGREYVGLCPFHSERTPSFSVVPGKDFFHCFGCGAHGGAIEFVMRADQLDFRQAVAKLAAGDWSAATPPIASRPDDGNNGNNQSRIWARRLWRGGRDPCGTLVETYLRGRGLCLPPAPVLRWTAGCFNRETGRVLPGMLARVDDVAGRFAGVHRTWLSPDGRKAALENPKKSLGHISGAAVRLAPAARVLAIAEGIENAIAVIVATGLPAWSAVSAGGVASLLLPNEVEEVVIWADHDAAGLRATEKGADRWLGEGRKVRLALSPQPGTDVNDLLIGGVRDDNEEGDRGHP